MNSAMMLKAVNTSMVRGFNPYRLQPFYVDKDTVMTLLEKALDKSKPKYPDGWFNDTLDAYAKHAYFELEM